MQTNWQIDLEAGNAAFVYYATLKLRLFLFSKWSVRVAPDPGPCSHPGFTGPSFTSTAITGGLFLEVRKNNRDPGGNRRNMENVSTQPVGQNQDPKVWCLVSALPAYAIVQPALRAHSDPGDSISDIFFDVKVCESAL